jgi:hypothetical protein
MTVAALAQCAIIYRLAGRITRLPGREKGREPIHSPAPDQRGIILYPAASFVAGSLSPNGRRRPSLFCPAAH